MKPENLQKINKNLSKKLEIKNHMALPQIEHVTVFTGVGKIKGEKDLLEQIKNDLVKITGQKPISSRAHKSIAAFKLREGDIVGLKVTLRKKRMYDFLEKVAKIVLPSQRDFRGLNPKSFDKENNFNLGFKEQTVFTEIAHEHAARPFGLQVTIKINGKNKTQAQTLLEELGFPFVGEVTKKGK